jgi:hypothetical protein
MVWRPRQVALAAAHNKVAVAGREQRLGHPGTLPEARNVPPVKPNVAGRA